MRRCIKLVFGSLSFIVALIAIGMGYLKLDGISRQKLFASVMYTMSDPNDTRIMNLRCNELLKHSTVKGHVLEIGAGTGINFPCLHNNTNIESYTGLEPNIHMHSYFYKFIQQWDIPYEIRLSNNSATDMHHIEANSVHTIIMTFVLCSVPDPLPEKVLLEAHRILKPGGTFIFIEHIAANSETNPFTYGFQKAIEPLWFIIGDGCQFKPMTHYFDAAKNVYSKVDYEYIDLPVPLFMIKYGVKGKLVK
ncbi:unnamed protein product [Rotaria socialis]|uniref:Methyltransferase type 11 domain-containing protein n=1 Tax=Rotaria socialis TaxID=392032 RepID=A0A817YAK2_9BILA|nr:unnamed protein product [Rotaria socialis]CAF3379307.1 unnamed protein product [Rotaria socialis]CAF3432340.1 unnamed protein product [Rotaria socialis]CAF3437828.1 unnamed protein product [Rotaria socialis]CAF3724086.1 unnamed protein product [Rotaria socialis]